jgi:glycosyltransferase involved in cell wall biosynthesis
MTCPLTPDVTSCRTQERAVGAESCADPFVERVDAELASAIGIINEKASSSDGQTPSSAPASSHPRLSGYAVRLPVWGKTDRSSSWREFALGASCPEVRAAVDDARIDVLVYVDWTGHNAAAALLELCPVERRPARLVFFSFCVFSALWGLSADDVAFYQAQEAMAFAGAHVVLCLCPKDRGLLLAAAASHTPGTSSSHTPATSSQPATYPKIDAHQKLEDMHPKIDNTHPKIEDSHPKTEASLVDRLHVVLPPLRQDMFQLAAARDPWAPCTRADCQFQKKQNSGGEGVGGEGGEGRGGEGKGGGGLSQRSLVVCCLRQVEAKNVLLFSEAMVELQALMRGQGLTPYLCGAAGDVEYADACRRTLEEAYPGSTGAGFLGPHELAHVMQHALLNVHTSPYEAYGMTIVEAAAFGVPTLMHVRDIGASELLPPASDTDPHTPTQRHTDTDSDMREKGGVDRWGGGEEGGGGGRGGGGGAAGESSLVVDMSGSVVSVASCLREAEVLKSVPYCAFT